MNDTSAVTRVGRNGSVAQSSDRAFVPSITVTRGVGAKALVELVSADVERDHGGRAVLEQAVGEPARRGSDVEASLAGDVAPNAGAAPSRASPRRATRTAAARPARPRASPAVGVPALVTGAPSTCTRPAMIERLRAASRLDEAALGHEQRVKP